MKEILILNLTNGTKIGKVEIADSFFSRFMGLMFRKNVDNGMLLKLPKVGAGMVQQYTCYLCVFH